MQITIEFNFLGIRIFALFFDYGIDQCYQLFLDFLLVSSKLLAFCFCVLPVKNIVTKFGRTKFG